MKYMNEFGLREGTQAEYVRRHDRIWPEMVTLIDEAGLRNYSIWNVDTRLIEYFECDDYERAVEILHASPVKARWDAYMKDILILGEGGAKSLTCFFDLDPCERKNNHG